MAEINRPLTDEERSLLLALATRNIADETGCTHDKASDVLENFVTRGQVELAGDARVVRVLVAGHLRVEAARDWLAFHAAYPGNDPMKDEKREGKR
jgi:hypothetical protein